MRGPFAIVLGAALALLIVAVYFSLAPAVGGSIESSSSVLGHIQTVSLLGWTNVSVAKAPIANVYVSNTSDFAATSILRSGTDYSYVSSPATITLIFNTGNPNVNGTYYAKFDESNWVHSVNANVVEGGTFFGQNQTWIALLFLGIVAAVVIGMFMRW